MYGYIWQPTIIEAKQHISSFFTSYTLFYLKLNEDIEGKNEDWKNSKEIGERYGEIDIRKAVEIKGKERLRKIGRE